MSEIFISYKREDEARVGRLVKALGGAGLSVWWDRSLPGGESWREQIQTALLAAKCVIVVWTNESVGATGDFVRDEASQAKRRGVLVPVMLDKVDPPLGFGEIQAINLTHWKGSSRDPFFMDLCAAVAAKAEGRPVPPGKGPMKRMLRRLTYSGVASAIGFGVLAFGLDLFKAQEQVCGVALLQPQISDVCGMLGLGARPTKIERLAWEGREPGSCADLRAHIGRFPQGAFRGHAEGLLAVKRVTQEEIWEPGSHRLVLFAGQGTVPTANEASAQSAALARAQTSAERLCRGFAATMQYRVTSAKPAAQIWNCEEVLGGVVCGFEGEAACGLLVRKVQEFETCGP
ncbi:MAG: toll/interleukin-1 receptor domain-containing protein [bacterium]|nr:toll/interleukin-1 receptor domain-containing protein [bacterium]